jgi:hypothetical protein
VRPNCKKEFLLVHKLNKYSKTKLNATGRRAGEASENICRDFLGNKKAENFGENVQELILLYSAIGCNTSLKLLSLVSYLIFFLPTWE